MTERNLDRENSNYLNNINFINNINNENKKQTQRYDLSNKILNNHVN